MTNRDLHHFCQKVLSGWRVSCSPAYCKQQSLVYHRLIYWNQKLNKTPDDRAGSQSVFARVAPVPKGQASDGLTVSSSGGVSIAGLHAGNIELGARF